MDLRASGNADGTIQSRMTYGDVPDEEIIKQGYLKYISNVSNNGFVWGTIMSIVDYLVLYSHNPAHGIDVSHRIGSIPLEGAKVEIAVNLLTVTTKAGTKHQFSGRTATELDAWKDAISKAQKQKTTNSLWSKWQKFHNPNKPGDSSKGPDFGGKEEALSAPPDGSFVLQKVKHNKQSYTLGKLISELEIGVLVLLGNTGSGLSQVFLNSVGDLRRAIISTRVHFIGMATDVKETRALAASIGFPGNVFNDEKGQLHKFCNCNWGLKLIIHPYSLREAKKTESPLPPKKEFSNPEQLGGIVLFSSTGVLLEWQQLYSGHLPPVELLAKFVEEQVLKLNSDTWSSTVKRGKREWSEIVQPEELSKKDKSPLFNFASKETWVYETGKSDVPYATPNFFLEHTENFIPYYKTLKDEGGDVIYFCERELSGSEASKFIVAIEPKDGRKERRAIIFTPEGHYRLLVPGYSVHPCQNIAQRLWDAKPSKVLEASNKSVREKLQEYEETEIKERTRFKFGVLYLKPGQEDDENLQYSNDKGSPEYDKFLELLGEKVELNDLGDRYAADSEAKESVYTKFGNMEIMFHVSTLLPNNPNDQQKIERKRHLASDAVIILFKEPGCKVNVANYSSTFTNVYMVVEPIKKQGKEVKYKIGLAVNNIVIPFSPFVPYPSVFKHNEETRSWILTKLINGERATMQSSASYLRILQLSRKRLINALIDPSDNSSSSNAPTSTRTLNKSISTLSLASRIVSGDKGEKGDLKEGEEKEKEKDKEKEKMRILRQANLKSKVEKVERRPKSSVGESIRLVITGEKIQDDIIRTQKNLHEILSEIKYLTGQEVEQLKLRSVILSERHVEYLNDLDILEVVLKQGGGKDSKKEKTEQDSANSKSEQDSENRGDK